jgi:hypothetical protein
MNLLTITWDFRSLWSTLPLQTRVYLLCLLAAAILSGISLSQTFVRLRKLQNSTPESEAEGSYRCLAARLHSLRQLHFLLLLLFGVLLTDEAFRTIRSFTYSRMSIGAPSVTELSAPLLVFAFLVLFVVAFLHCLQWFVSSRLESFACSFDPVSSRPPDH